MITIIYRQPDGSEQLVNAPAGTSIMQAAIHNGINGIVGECGGSAMCATCHVHVVDGMENFETLGEMESEMLDCTASPRTDRSRLSCQLFVPADGQIIVDVPDRQV